jgi:hypothetical protein
MQPLQAKRRENWYRKRCSGRYCRVEERSYWEADFRNIILLQSFARFLARRPHIIFQDKSQKLSTHVENGDRQAS